MLKCLGCHNVFEYEELDYVNEDRGEFWGMPAYERISVCPICGCDEFDDYIEPSEDEDEDEEMEDDE